MMDRDFLQARIDATKTEIIAYETAVSALIAGGIQQYSLDTGQSRQTVTKLDVNRLSEHIDSLYNRCATLEARLSGATIHARPNW